MNEISIDFETPDFLVVRNRETVIFRCPIDLTDLGQQEPLGRFITRHGGIEGTSSYLREMLKSELRRGMGLRFGLSRYAPSFGRGG